MLSNWIVINDGGNFFLQSAWNQSYFWSYADLNYVSRFSFKRLFIHDKKHDIWKHYLWHSILKDRSMKI